MASPHSELQGIRLMLQASVAFSLMALGVKWAGRWIPFIEIVFIRSVIGLIMILFVIHRRRAPLIGREWGLMLLRGFCGFSALMFYFFTLTRLPLGVAVLLNYTSPVFVAILSAIFLNERFDLFLSAMLLLAFAGIYLLTGAGTVFWSLTAWNTYVLMGLLSAIFAAMAYVLIRKLHEQESPYTIIFYFTAVSTAGSATLLPPVFVWPPMASWLPLLLVGLGAFWGQLWLTHSLRHARASVVSLFSYAGPLLSFLYGYLFFGEALSRLQISGAFLIVLSCWLVSYRGNRRARLAAES